MHIGLKKIISKITRIEFVCCITYCRIDHKDLQIELKESINRKENSREMKTLYVSQVFISLNAFCWFCLLTEPRSPVQGMEELLYPRRLTSRRCWWRHCSRGRKILKTIKNSDHAVSSCLGDRLPPCEHRFIALARGSARILFAHEFKRARAILGKTTKY